jgi:large subunit ribosomal protein L5e
MAFVKVVKNRAYFKKFQTKYRRRREGKTDYGARRVMVRQEKNKYNSAKYRLIVRFTNKRCIAQIVYSTIEGDKVMMHADSTQLEKYGLKVGLKNYAAGYCVGLLLARRMLDKVGLADAFEGQKEPDGEEFHIEDDYDGDRRPFKAILDVGLKRTTVGSKVFSVLKGAADGGLHIPHSTKKFPGYKPASGEEKGEYDADFHKQRIFGGHVAEHMESLKEEDEQEYEKVYSKYIEEGVADDDLEDLYGEVHKKIREDPVHEKKEPSVAKPKRDGNDVKSNGKTWTRMVRLTFQERKERVAARIAKHAEKMLAED